MFLISKHASKLFMLTASKKVMLNQIFISQVSFSSDKNPKDSSLPIVSYDDERFNLLTLDEIISKIDTNITDDKKEYVKSLQKKMKGGHLSSKCTIYYVLLL